jgi:hypothetical protein
MAWRRRRCPAPRRRHTRRYEEPLRGRFLIRRGYRRSPWGDVLRVQLGRVDGRRMGWMDIERVFSTAFPGRWALQVFPPLVSVVDKANVYHLWVLPPGVAPEPLTIDRRRR